MSATSSWVQTATTPGNALAASVSIAMRSPCATCARTTRIESWRGKFTSAANSPCPRTSGRSSNRVTLW
eukprot:gene2170-2206_t